MRILMLWLAVLVGEVPKPELHLYTTDGKPIPGWEMRDFETKWHKSKFLTKEQQALGHPLVLHYAKGDGWVYDTTNLTKRKFRQSYRKLNGITAPGQKTLVWTHAEGCGPCKRMEPFLPELRKLVEVEEVYWDWETPGEFGITSVPLTVLLDADGKELKRWVGYVTLQEIKGNL